MDRHHDAHAAFRLGVGVAPRGRPPRAARARARRSRAALARRRAGLGGWAPRARAPRPGALPRRIPERLAAAAGHAAGGASAARAGDADQALDAFRRFRAMAPPAQRLEGRFWEAEALYRVKRFAEARAGYDEVMRRDAASPLAPDAAYGLALCELELRRPEAAVKAFRDLITTWPEHPQAPSGAFYLAQP